MSYKPENYPSVAAYLIVADAQATLDFATRTFGADTVRAFRDDEGVIRHAEMRIDDTIVMLGQMEPGIESLMHVYVPDVDACYARALAAGGRAIEAPVGKPDGDRRGGVRDANGIQWWMATGGDAA